MDLARALPADFPAPVPILVVLHPSPRMLLQQLGTYFQPEQPAVA
jgi:hypothetical protein